MSRELVVNDRGYYLIEGEPGAYDLFVIDLTRVERFKHKWQARDVANGRTEVELEP